MAKKQDFQITRALQNTLLANPKIKEVYFNEDGDFFFQKFKLEVHEIDEETGMSKGSQHVETLPGAVKGLVKIKTVINRIPTYKDAFVNIAYNPIAITLTRDEILASQAVSDRKTEKEKLEILTAAAEIAKSSDFQDLLNKINEKIKK